MDLVDLRVIHFVWQGLLKNLGGLSPAKRRKPAAELARVASRIWLWKRNVPCELARYLASRIWRRPPPGCASRRDKIGHPAGWWICRLDRSPSSRSHTGKCPRRAYNDPWITLCERGDSRRS